LDVKQHFVWRWGISHGPIVILIGGRIAKLDVAQANWRQTWATAAALVVVNLMLFRKIAGRL
jgi:hypothetical protein